MTGANRPSGRADGAAPSWKVALALVSLALSLLLWLNGLIDSLSRPSVGNDLNRRQLELAVLAEPELSGPLRNVLAGRNPIETLRKAIADELQEEREAGRTPDPDLLLEQALLLRRQHQGQTSSEASPVASDALLAEVASGSGPQANLAQALLEPQATASRAPNSALIAALPEGGVLRIWSCEALSPDAACGAARASRQAALQLIAVSVLPVALLVVGSGTLLRELWQRWRGRAADALPLQGPALSGLDAVLLIAGGFVVVGELLTPLLVGPVIAGLLQRLAVASPLREGISVVSLYLALMAGPLLILALMLRGKGEAGWLQFRWTPLGLSVRQALQGLLMVLPLVSLVGWLQGQLWGDPGGSNPLLELVLNSHNVPALACFGFTAVVLAPLFEETIFRGALLPVAGRKLGATGGILLSGAVFAVAHLSLGELLPLLVLGIGLGWVRWSSGRLGSCVLMHALWNGLTFANLVVLGW
ncbi:lysostaphin resistance A-like protein [Synechococcus sp. HK05]|uniref:lysostaphin resistance A-like protein n=1 Tax=Synechococcus sp. HK05 TaxID=2725975 RepID=UPI0034CD493C